MSLKALRPTYAYILHPEAHSKSQLSAKLPAATQASPQAMSMILLRVLGPVALLQGIGAAAVC